MTPWRQIALAHDDDACRLAAWLHGCGLTPGQAADLLYGTYVAPAVEEVGVQGAAATTTQTRKEAA